MFKKGSGGEREGFVEADQNEGMVRGRPCRSRKSRSLDVSIKSKAPEATRTMFLGKDNAQREGAEVWVSGGQDTQRRISAFGGMI